MRNERVEVTRGTAKILTSHFTLLAIVLAVGLTACGKSNPTTAPGSPTLQSIALSPSAVTISTGTPQQFTVTGTYSDNTTKTISDGINWSSSSPIVAKMSGPGSCISTSDSTALGDRDDADPSIYYGTTTIIASVGSLSAQATVRVNGATLQSISIEPATAQVPLPSGGNAPVITAFTAWGHYSDNTKAPLIGAYACEPAPAPPCVAWTTSNGNAIIDASGFAQAVAGAVAGPVTITATYGNGAFSSTATLDVTAPVLLSIAVSPSVASVPALFGKQFTVTGQYSDGTNPVLTTGVTWSSSNTTVATMIAGMASALQTGSTSITAVYGGFTSTAVLNVTAAPTDVAEADLPFDGGVIDASGTPYYKVTGLTAGLDYLVSLTSLDPNVFVQVFDDATFAPVGLSFAGTPPGRGGVANLAGELFMLVSGLPGTAFSLNVEELNVISAGSPAIASVDTTEKYYKVTGLTPGLRLATLAGLTDDAEFAVYGGPSGSLAGATLALCQSRNGARSATPVSFNTEGAILDESCSGLVPASGVVYVSVEGWLTAAGTPFTLTVQ